MIKMPFIEYMFVNTQPAESIKLACEGSESSIIVEDGVITDIVKENEDV